MQWYPSCMRVTHGAYPWQGQNRTHRSAKEKKCWPPHGPLSVAWRPLHRDGEGGKGTKVSCNSKPEGCSATQVMMEGRGAKPEWVVGWPALLPLTATVGSPPAPWLPLPGACLTSPHFQQPMSHLFCLQNSLSLKTCYKYREPQ